MNKLFLLFSLSVFCCSVNAEIYPRSLGLDPRVQQIKYNPNNVVVVGVKDGIATLIQLEEDEEVAGDATGMGIGDPMAWNINVRGNNIFLRPVAEQPDTNISLVTNKRTYSIQLKYKDKNPTYILKYAYDKPPKDPLPIFKNKVIKMPCTDAVFNGSYQVKGSEHLKPTSIWDDGIFTCFRWYNNNDLPVVYRVLPDGKEQLVNFHMDEDTGVMVVHEVANEFVLRLGDEVMNARTMKKLIRPYNSNNKLMRKDK